MAKEPKLPLAEPTAAVIAAALVEPAASTLVECVRACLAVDPYLTLLAVVSAWQHSRSEPATLADLAASLASDLSRFDWSRLEDDAALTATAADLAKAAGEGVALGQLARRLAGPQHADTTELLGHLLPAIEVLATMDWLPPRLASQLAELSSKSTASPAIVAVRKAQAIARGNSRGKSTKPADRAAFARRSAEAAARWSAAGPWTEALPSLAARGARLAELERDFARQLEAAKLASLKEFAYGAGHEINNPLANISARAQTLLVGETDPERRRLLGAIHSQALRAYEMIADLMLFARPPQLARQWVDVADLVGRLVDGLQTEARSRASSLTFLSLGEPLFASVDPTQLAVAVRAVCANALEAVEAARIEVQVVASSSQDAAIEIIVDDNGPGIPESARQHVFDPFYSGREAGRGLGFGLTKCWRIVDDHGGRIDIAPSGLGGARFTLRLPRGQAPAASGAAANP